MATFVLIHGAWHGPWCWERLTFELEAAGHGAIAVDLPCEDVDAGLAAYAEAVGEQSSAAGDDVVAVAHSMTGLVLPLVAAVRPVRALVYLNAFVPLPGVSMADQFAAADEPILLLEGGREIDEQGRSAWIDPGTTARLLYPDLSPEEAAWAFSRLRPQAATSQREPCPADLPPAPSQALVSPDDRILNPVWAQRVARERLGTEPVAVAGGHFPMLTEPAALAAALGRIASGSGH